MNDRVAIDHPDDSRPDRLEAAARRLIAAAAVFVYTRAAAGARVRVTCAAVVVRVELVGVPRPGLFVESCASAWVSKSEQSRSCALAGELAISAMT